VQYAHTILKTALKHAVRGKLLRENPCDHARPGTAEKAEMQVWTADEVQFFLERTREDRDYALWHTLLYTGMRPGEAAGLRWGDVQGDRLHIVRAVTDTGLEAPKTERSKRAVALTKASLEALQAHRKAQAAEILAAGPAYTRQDLIFPSANGSLDQIALMRRRWQRATKRASKGRETPLKPIRLYDTRHTHATLMLKAGVHVKVVSERLGHATTAITMDVYSHVLPDMQDAAVEKLEALLAPKETLMAAAK
jgi:integrase